LELKINALIVVSLLHLKKHYKQEIPQDANAVIVLVIRTFEFRICFEFRASDFGFAGQEYS
jgi:hypothetical protein